jgi:hypothetical protein
MPNELIIGMAVGFTLFLIFLVLRSFMSPKEIEMDSYSPSAPAASPGSPVSTVPASYGDFHFTIEDTFGIKGRGLVVTGKVLGGSITVGQRLHVIAADGTRYETNAKSIEAFKKPLKMAQAGDYIGILLPGLTKEQVKKGMQVCVLN